MEKQQEFIDKYKALCEEYGMQIAPQLSLQVVLTEPKEETKDATK